MADWAVVALRFAVYLDLMLLFGLTAYPLYSSSPARLVCGRAVLSTLAGLGLVLSFAAFLQMTAGMAGVAVGDLDRETLLFILQDTQPGHAFAARTVALLALVGIGFATSRSSIGWIAATASAAALASLAWTGHAAITEGNAGWVHRLADIVHLLAAAAWIGALAVLASIFASPIDGNEGIAQAEGALMGFSRAGSVIVALVTLTGLINGWMIFGFEGLKLLPDVLYGQLLIAKLLLFGAMLSLAAANRWRLTPQLALARATGDTVRGVRALRISIVLEAGAATLILALVAWLGTLEPPPAM